MVALFNSELSVKDRFTSRESSDGQIGQSLDHRSDMRSRQTSFGQLGDNFNTNVASVSFSYPPAHLLLLLELTYKQRSNSDAFLSETHFVAPPKPLPYRWWGSLIRGMIAHSPLVGELTSHYSLTYKDFFALRTSVLTSNFAT